MNGPVWRLMSAWVREIVVAESRPWVRSLRLASKDGKEGKDVELLSVTSVFNLFRSGDLTGVLCMDIGVPPPARRLTSSTRVLGPGPLGPGMGVFGTLVVLLLGFCVHSRRHWGSHRSRAVPCKHRA